MTSSEMTSLHTTVQGKASKAAVANALKSRIDHEELDAVVNRITLGYGSLFSLCLIIIDY